jgi:UDPglucose 6-dehydrogenase
MAKKITVVGTGYVGLLTSVGLADFGNTVTGVDIDKKKIDLLNSGKAPIYEPGIEEYLNRNLKSGRLKFSADVGDAIRNSEVVFIAVGTPAKENGEADLSFVHSVAKAVAENLNSYKVVITKSTVPVGTNAWIRDEINKMSGKTDFDVVSNPEFLREGKAVHDFFHPDRVVVGSESLKAKEVLEDIYRSLYINQTPFVWCNLETAEMIKYASNAFLAVKITFINQIANLSEAVGADVQVIAKAMGMDGRISPKFLHPGPGYGGSCFPKDTRALAETGEKYGVSMSLIREVISSNEAQKIRMVSKLEKIAGSLKGKTVAFLGLAFKPETDDVREAPALTIIPELIKKGAVVKAHDPKGTENFKKEIGPLNGLFYYENEFEAAKDADLLFICTEWNEYRNMDFEKLKKQMNGSKILDARNCVNKEDAEKAGFVYKGVGR